jgi:hypothetical protein
MTIRTLSTKRTKKVNEPVLVVCVIFVRKIINFDMSYFRRQQSRKTIIRINDNKSKIYHRRNQLNEQVQIEFQVNHSLG